MKMLQERYRKDYLGEFVVVKSIWKNGKKEQEREWIDNPIDNSHISGRAAIIGNGVSKAGFNIRILERHNGGLLGKKRLQTYASDGTWKQIQPNFYVSNNKAELKEIIESKYSENNIIYTSARKCIDNPGQFYLIPYDTILDDTATAAWIAAFDGHQEIFLIGVDGTNADNSINNRKIADLNEVIKTYTSVKFYAVTDGQNPPGMWRKNPNFSIMTYRQWFNYCDV